MVSCEEARSTKTSQSPALDPHEASVVSPQGNTDGDCAPLSLRRFLQCFCPFFSGHHLRASVPRQHPAACPSSSQLCISPSRWQKEDPWHTVSSVSPRTAPGTSPGCCSAAPSEVHPMEKGPGYDGEGLSISPETGPPREMGTDGLSGGRDRTSGVALS